MYDCDDGSDEFYCKDISCPNTTLCSCGNQILTLNCHKKLDMNWKIFFYVKYLNLEKIIEIENSYLKNFKIVWLRLTRTKTKVLQLILPNFQNLIYLNLSENYLEKIKSFNFIKNFQLIQNLDLSKNLIKFLDKSSFLNLRNLLYLNLSENSIKIIKHLSFTHLTQMKELIISKNLEMIQLEKRSFHNLINLKTLRFKSKIEDHVTKLFFTHLIYMEYSSFLTNKYCCYLENLRKTINCSYKYKELKNCDKNVLNFSETITLFFFALFLISFILLDLFLSFKISKNHFSLKKCTFSITSNLTIVLYFLLCFLHYVLIRYDVLNEDENIWKRITKNSPCIIAKLIFNSFPVFYLFKFVIKILTFRKKTDFSNFSYYYAFTLVFLSTVILICLNSNWVTYIFIKIIINFFFFFDKNVFFNRK